MSELGEFAARAEGWLTDNAERRPPAEELGWGKGSDSVALFKNLLPDEERAHIEALRQWQRRKSEAGYGSISWPVRYGGAGLPPTFEQAFRSLEAQFITPNGHEAVGITLDLVGPTIRSVGSDTQKDRYLRPLRRTDEMWCQLFSEPGAGSDLASLSTRAELDGSQWRINGQKVWTSGAQFADYGYALCRTDPTAPKHSGITAFIIPMNSAGLDVRPLRQMSGGSSFNEVFFTDVLISDELRLGPVGEGWRVALTTLGFERAAATRTALSSEDLFARLLLAARHFGLSEEPLIRQRLVDIYSISRMRSMTRRRLASEAGAAPGPEGSIGKLAWTDGLRKVAEAASAILGVRLVTDGGEWGTFAWNEFVCGVPGYRIAGGSDEVQRNIIAERVLGLPKGPQ